MPNFDIRILDTIEPPRMHCTKCLALIWEPDVSFSLDLSTTAHEVVYTACPLCQTSNSSHLHPACPVCGVQYLSARYQTTLDLSYFLLEQHPSPWNYNITEEANIIAFSHHCRTFGSLAARIQEGQLPPARGLLETIASAQSFIHWTSFGPLADKILDALINAAQRIPVRGIIANVNRGDEATLAVMSRKTRNLSLKSSNADFYTGDVLHQQLFVIDGLLAFRGSANRALAGDKITLSGTPILEVVSESDAVFTLHNRYFAPLWAEHSSYGNTILMP